jgi:DME family drug/metabolite transporter
LVLGAVVLFLFALGRGSFSVANPWPKGWALAAALGVGAYQAFFFSSVAQVGVAVGTVVTLGTSTVGAGLLTLWLDGKPLGPRWIFATGLGLAGVCLLAAWPGGPGPRLLGISLAVGAGLSYAGLTFASKRLLTHLEPAAAMAVVFTLAAVFALPILPFLDFKWLAQPVGLAVGTHLGLVTIGAAYFFYSRGLTQVTVATAVTLSLAEPATATLLGLTLLGEKLSPAASLGLALIFSGLLLAAFQGPPAGLLKEIEHP